MNQANLIHIHKERQMEPYWWIMTFTVYTIGLLLGVTFIVAPITLFFIFKKYWILIFLLFLPLGIWMLKKIPAALTKLIWKNRHTSTYTLLKGTIEFNTWDNQTKQNKKDSFSFGAIDYVVSGMYVLENNHVYTKSGFTERVKQTALLPILYIIYTINGEKQLVSVPFYDEPAINTWLRTFQEENIRLYYTDLLLYPSSGEKRLSNLEEGGKILPFTFENNWFSQSIALSRQWNEAYAENKVNQPSNETDTQVHMDKTEQSKSRKKLPFKKWLNVALVTYAFLVIGIYITVLLAENGTLSEDSLVPGMLLLAVTSFIYFFMLKDSRYWGYIIRFCIESFIVIIIAFIALYERGAVADAMLTSIISSSLLFVVVSWVPYVIVSYIKKAKA